MKYRKASHTTFDCRYHIVWVTKFRNDALWDRIQKRLRGILGYECEKMYVNVISMWMEEDHVHMYVSIPVSKPIPYVVQILKWISSKIIREEFSDYLKRWYWDSKSLWARWYFVATVWEITNEIVKNYVENQWKEEVLWIEVEL